MLVSSSLTDDMIPPKWIDKKTTTLEVFYVKKDKAYDKRKRTDFIDYLEENKSTYILTAKTI